MSKTKPIILFLIMTLAGCATPSSETPTAMSHHHITGKTPGRKVSKQQPLYVSATDDTPFNQAAVGELIASLVSNGYTVVKTRGTTINVEINTQVLRFSLDRLQARQVGALSALATGLWALTELNASITPAGVATGVIFAGDAQAYFNSDKASGPTPQTEIIINATVSDNSRYLAVSRATYYATASAYEYLLIIIGCPPAH